MKHAPITWEWVLVFVSSVIFMSAAEAWKLVKRTYFRRTASKSTEEGTDVGLAIFDQWRTMSVSGTATLVV